MSITSQFNSNNEAIIVESDPRRSDVPPGELVVALRHIHIRVATWWITLSLHHTHRKFGDVWTRGSWQPRRTDRRTCWRTCSSQYRSPTDGEVMNNTADEADWRKQWASAWSDDTAAAAAAAINKHMFDMMKLSGNSRWMKLFRRSRELCRRRHWSSGISHIFCQNKIPHQQKNTMLTERLNKL